MQFSYTVFLIGALLGIVQLGVGILIGRALVAGRHRTHAPRAAEASDLEKFVRQLHRLLAAVVDDVNKHQVQIEKLSRDLDAVHEADAGALADYVLNVVSKIAQVNAWLQKRLHAAEERLDIQSKQLEAHLTQALTDPLTQLPNRRAFDAALEHSVDQWHRAGKPFCLILLDADLFKRINDAYGHLAGDGVLRNMAQRLREALDETHTVARLGGDEFAVILPESDLSEGKQVASRICRVEASRPFRYEGHDLQITVSLGVAAIGPSEDAPALLRRADDALYASKRAGRNRAYYHDQVACRPIDPDQAKLPDDFAGCRAAIPMAGASPSADADLEAICDGLRERLAEVVDDRSD